MRIVVLILIFTIGLYTVPALSETTDEMIRKDSEKTWTLLEMEFINAEGKINAPSFLDWSLVISEGDKSILIDRKCWEILEIAHFEYIEQGVLTLLWHFKRKTIERRYQYAYSSQAQS